jgi:LmbE family N-acetylglucosaminyl deacetylase
MLNPEHLLVPYQTSPLPPGPWLVFAPHADDETYGMGGSLLKASSEGIETHVVVMTDGALGGEAENLVAVRNQEVQAATAMLGVKSLQCWNQPDRGLTFNEPLLEKISKTVLELAPASIFFPGPLEIHPDHRATALLIWAALQRLQQKNLKNGLMPTPFAYEISAQSPVNCLIDITGQRALKEKVMAVYASQNSQNNYEDIILALNKARTFSLPGEVSFAEGFYRFSSEELSLPLKAVMHKIIDLYL